jgi:protein-tyrosine phosphatase
MSQLSPRLRDLVGPDGGRRLLNFRSLAGTRAADGRAVLAGRLFRGGHVADLPAPLADALRQAGLARVCDLRSAREQRGEPSGLTRAGFAAAMPPPDGDPTLALRVAGDPTASPADVRAAMLATYAAFPDSFAAALGQVMAAAIDGPGGLMVQCAIGKDRTGAAVALLLAALGVPRGAILADYTATNQARAAIWQALAARNADRAPPPDAMVAPLIAADPDYLAAFWDRLDTDWGGEAGYLVARFGIGAAEIGALRARWLG